METQLAVATYDADVVYFDFETFLVFSAPFTLFVIRFRNMRSPAHTHPLSGKPPAKHISFKSSRARVILEVSIVTIGFGTSLDRGARAEMDG